MAEQQNQRSRGDQQGGLDKDTGGGGLPEFTRQESGASGGGAPASGGIEGTGEAPDRPGERAGPSGSSYTSARPGEPAQRDNASQNQVQGTADADADHETHDRSEGLDKRMD